jgi:hypothetical protein
MHGGHVGSSVDQKSQTSASIVNEIVRYLIARPGIGPGSRVLLCGIANPELIHGLTNLGLLVSCTNEDATESESLQQTIPEADCCEGNVPREQFDRSDAGFNLVVVPAPYKNDCPSVFSRPRMMELASRLACIHPSGCLVQLGGSNTTSDARVTHSLKCCLRQVSAFPGRNSIRSFGGQIRLRYARRSSEYAISLQIPDERMSPFEWDLLALNASKRLPADCCRKPANSENVERAA